MKRRHHRTLRRPVMTARGHRAVLAGVLCLTMTVGGGLSAAAEAATASPASGSATATTATTTPGAPPPPLSPAMAQWKKKYLYVIGHVAGDVLVVVTDGTKGRKHPTKANIKQTLNDCRTWEKDAHKAIGKAPPIPSPIAEAVWKRLVSSSESASSDCVTSFKTGSKKAAKRFRAQLVVVHGSEEELSAIFSG
jgi:hypothetical protein